MSANAAAVRRQRIDARAHVASKRSGGADGDAHAHRRAALDELDQRSSAKIRLPRTRGAALHAVTVNTAGGLTGDDRIRWSARAGRGSHLVLSSAACEKVYRSHGPDAHQATVLAVEAGARLEWLPQETILYEGGRLARTLEVDIAGDGALVACEAVVLGRGASGERVRRGRLTDRWRVRRDGRLVHAEALALGDDMAALHADAAGLGAFRAFATVLACDGRGEAACADLAARIDRAVGAGTAAGTGRASALPGRVVFRALAADARALRALLLPALGALCEGRALPRVWHV